MYSDILENELKPVVQSIDNILNLDDNLFTEQTVDKVSRYVTTVFNQQVREEMIKSCINTFKEQSLTKEESVEGVKILVEAIKEYIEDHEGINEKKKQIVNVLTASVEQAMNEAIEECFKDNNTHTVYFELIHPNAKIPTYAHNTDAGADIYIPEDVTIPPAARGIMVHTGLKAVIPDGWEIQIRPRSGLSHKTNLRISNCVGTLDSGYRGEICILIDNLGASAHELKAGDRIAQMVLAPVYHFNGVVVDSVDSFSSERNTGGFGSSGN